MSEPDPAAVAELEAMMVELSERWSATWMRGVEFALWDAVQGRRTWLGLVEITEDEAARARQLSERIGGWVTWPDDWDRPGYVPVDAWREQYSRRAADTRPFPRLIFGPGHNDRTRAEMTLRGYVSHVWVQTDADTFCPVFFYDPVRLRQDLAAETQLGRPYLAEPGLIMVPEVTEAALTAAIEALYRDGYFAHLRPAPPPKE